MSPLRIRVASAEDAGQIRAIYAPYVESSSISFETEVPDIETMRARIARLLPTYPWLACADGERIVGYAYASPHNERAGYRWSAQVTAYVHADFHRGGIGKRLYAALCTLLRAQGCVNAFGGIALPNAASVALHESFGFRRCATYRNAGYKLGAWHDVGWWQLELRPLPALPAEPIAFSRLPASALAFLD